MTDQSPSTVLRQAAAKVREMAAQLPDPWRRNDDCVVDDPSGLVCRTSLGEEAEWIATFSPAIAEPLAAAFDAAAEMYSMFDWREDMTPEVIERRVNATDRPLLPLARLILEATSDG